MCFVAVDARAQQATLVADAHVSSAQPAVNAGTLSNLNVGGGYSALVQFDLGTLPAGVTAAQITRATLRVYCNRADTPGAVSAAVVNDAWGEYSVTYATLPATSSAISTANATAGEFVTFDVTAAVQEWVSAPTTNNGLALTSTAAVVQFDSKENDQTAHAPELIVATTVSSAGSVGPAGPMGATGATGAQGPAGLQGPAGAAGPAGAQGPAGPQGLPGPIGLTGATGVAGAAGAMGATGPMGLKGPVGATGAQGFVGPTGAAGAAGAQGVPGPAGPVGAQGLPGSVGPPGEQGPQGLQGIAGQAGAQGIPGVAGTTGLQGPMGPQGVAGPVGLSFIGPYSSTANYGVGDGVLWQGAGWVSMVPSNHGNTPDQSPTSWAMFAAAGAPGTAGAVGATGATGPQGSAGPQGVAGTDGAAGAPGATGTPGLVYRGAYASTANYALGDVVVWNGSSYASLMDSNHGNTPDLNAAYWGVLASMGGVGPAGPQGIVGLQGPIGLTGSIGPQGPAGVQGPQGPEGPVGAQGLTGTAGAQGAVGPQGPQGVAGQAGAQGVVGPAGPAGQQGPTGEQGPIGAVGATGAAGLNGAVGMNFRAAWSAQNNYAVNDAVTFAGSTYLAQAANNNIEPDSDAQTWMVIAKAGDAGVTPSMSVGSVTTLTAGSPATVTVTGTAQAAVLNFGIPAGATGPAGPTGPAGASGTSGTSATAASGSSFAAMYHPVNYLSFYYGVNTPNASQNEDSTVMAWVPLGCTATRLDVYSLQSGNITVTLRSGMPGAMADTLSCQPGTSGATACPATGSVAINAGTFLDLHITGASSTAAGVWTAVQCN